MRGRRLLLLLIGLPLYTAALMFVSTVAVFGLIDPMDLWTNPAGVFDPPLLADPSWWSWCGGPALILVATQAVFVLPQVRVDLRPSARRKSVVASLVVAAMVAAGLTVALACAVLELADVWDAHTEGSGAWELSERVWGWPVTLPVFVTSWVIWSGALLLFTRKRRHPGLLGRLVALLLAGTVVEVLAVIPIDVMVRRRTDCYCMTGTFHSLLISVWAAMWLAGPGVLILYVRRRRRRAAVRCIRCGYEKGPSPGPECTECGHSWRPG